MPLYALGLNQNIVAASDALPRQHYRCLECKTPMAKRVGLHRQAHFYHLQTIQRCRLYSRSVDHIILQAHFQKNNPALIIERPFQKILRIADLCWEEKKLIFEIQCSPIDVGDARQRVHDYREEGFDLVWLLDDRLFNRRHLRLAEAFMREQAGYFFSLQKLFVYDQFEVIDRDKRLFRGPPLPSDLCHPILRPATLPAVRQIAHRSVKYFFPGDLCDRIIRYPVYLQKIAEQEAAIFQKKTVRGFCRKWFYIGLEFLLSRTAARML